MKANSVCWLRSADATGSYGVAFLYDGNVYCDDYGVCDSGFSPACSI